MKLDFQVHFDDYAEFARTVRGFQQRIQHMHPNQQWYVTPIGTDLIQFCERYYPRWWAVLQKQMLG